MGHGEVKQEEVGAGKVHLAKLPSTGHLELETAGRLQETT